MNNLLTDFDFFLEPIISELKRSKLSENVNKISELSQLLSNSLNENI